MAWWKSKTAQILHEILTAESQRIRDRNELELKYATMEAEAKLKAVQLRQAKKISPYLEKKYSNDLKSLMGGKGS